jgi:hypothetical protein
MKTSNSIGVGRTERPMSLRFGWPVGLLLAGGFLGMAVGAFAQAGTCGGISGYPVNPVTGATLCSFTNPIVFFSPHPDDETLGMSGAILAAKAAGRTVIVELMTRGEGSGNCLPFFATTTDCANARLNEFTESITRLGVDGVVGGKDGRNNFGDKYLLYSNGAPDPSQGSNQAFCSAPNLTPNPGIASRISFWLAHGGPGLSLRGASGVDDIICHPDHYAVALALKNAGYPDTKYYQVYRVSDPNRDNATSTNWSGQTVTLTRENTNQYCGTPGTKDCTYASNQGSGKRGALSAYDIDCSASGLYAFGWGHSTGYLFDGYDGDCANGTAAEYVDAPTASGNVCGEATCVPPQGAYISHFTSPGCTGTESYYLPYDGYGYECRPWDGGGQCGTIQRTVTNRSYRYNGLCYDAWSSGNTLTQFVTVYRGCGEASCVPEQGAYISHFTGAACTGTESYYLPYDGYGYQCRTWDGSGQCGTVQHTVTNRSYSYNGTCYDAWPSGNTLSQFVTIYH